MSGLPQHLTSQETYISLLGSRRREVGSVLTGLAAEALNWLPVPHQPGEPKVSNSIYQLAYHCVVTEVDWRRHIAYRLGLLTREEESQGFEKGEFEVSGDTPSLILARLEQDGQETDHFIRDLTEEALNLTWLNPRGELRSVRWIIGHVIAHYGEHIGQMALTRQLWETRYGAQR